MYSDLLYILPILIRIAVLLIALSVFYNYYGRKWAKIISDEVKKAGASSPETAVSTASLEKSHHGIGLAANILLRRYSPLRRYIRCTEDIARNSEIENNSVAAQKKDKKAQKTKKKKAKKLSKRLNGKEKWYIVSPETAENCEAADVSHSRYVPHLLRDGGEAKLLRVIIGVTILIVFGEILVHFLPDVMDFFVGLSEVAKD